jgi:hypothetical protein
MNTDAILKDIARSKGPGKYQTTNYYNTSVGYSYNPGNNGYTSGINPSNVSDDTFLRNINIKNNKTINGNTNYMQQQTAKAQNYEGNLVNITRDSKSCNNVFEKDYFNMGFRTNEAVVDAQKHINFDTRLGIDSRHTRR